MRFAMLRCAYCLALAAALAVCPAAVAEQPAPKLVPLPDAIPTPEDNPSTPAKIALGKQLFFDPRLSGDGTMSCATCHVPEKAWGDGLALAKGRDEKPLARNTPSLLGAAWHTSLQWDGRAASLEEQALLPIQSPDEMNQDLGELVRKLEAVPGYAKQFREVFGGPATAERIGMALAAFQRTLVSRNAPLDRYLRGEKNALSEKARRGMDVFHDAGCIRCHHGPLLSDGKFYRLGVEFADAGRAAVTGKDEDRSKFRTPSLRDVARTGPYMHDGSKKTLFEAAEFYFRAAPTRSPDGLPLDIEPLLGHSYSDIDALVAFLEALSGEPPEIEPPRLP